MAAGRSFEEVDAMCMSDVEVIFDYWSKYPPINETTAAVHGVGAFAEGYSEPRSLPAEGYLTIDQLRASAAEHASLIGR